MSWNEIKQSGKQAMVVLLAVSSLLLALNALMPLVAPSGTLQAAPLLQESPLSPLVTDLPTDGATGDAGQSDDGQVEDAAIDSDAPTDDVEVEATASPAAVLPLVEEDTAASFGDMVASGQVSLVLIGALLLGILATVIAVLRRG